MQWITYLIRGRYSLATADFDTSLNDYEEAKQLIQKTGYHLRDIELDLFATLSGVFKICTCIVFFWKLKLSKHHESLPQFLSLAHRPNANRLAKTYTAPRPILSQAKKYLRIPV